MPLRCPELSSKPFSGPAASVMEPCPDYGPEDFCRRRHWGTTTDLALILEGKPLYASRGAKLGGHYTHVRSFAVRSIALGGDSAIRWMEGKLTIGPERLGPAACFGGPTATPTDAANLLAEDKLGNPELSGQALKQLSLQAGLTVEKLAQSILHEVNIKLETNIKEMFKSWEEEPAYRIWEIVNKKPVKLERVIGVGAAARAFLPALAQLLDCSPLVHHYSPVANALGAAVARPTLSLLLHADTQRETYSVNLEGITGKIDRNFQLKDAKELAQKQLRKIARDRGLGQYADRDDFFLEEQFNMIRGWSTVGKRFDVGIQIASGVIDEFEGVQP